MIPRAYIQEWSNFAPWSEFRQIEQDMIISRCICDLFNSPELKGKIAFRGGTAINKLLFKKPLRYSEDIDLVQIPTEPVHELFDAIHETLKWLGEFTYKSAKHSMHLFYKFEPEEAPGTELKLKIEINTREHANIHGFASYPFSMKTQWYEADSKIISFTPEELMGTKLRALLQRRKNRDLFDLNAVLNELSLDRSKIISSFEHYLELQDESISRAEAEERMLKKLTGSLCEDILPLLPAGVKFTDEDAILAFGRIWRELISNLKGEPWKKSQEVIERLRQERIPRLLE